MLQQLFCWAHVPQAASTYNPNSSCIVDLLFISAAKAGLSR